MRIIMGDLLTGRRILDVPFTAASWSVELNGPGTVSATVDLKDPTVRQLDMWNAAQVGKTFLAAVENDVILEAGPIWARKWERRDGKLTLEARGLWSYFDHRTLLPNIGDRPVTNPETGEAEEYANTTLKNLHLGTIGKRIVQQSMTWPGGNLPIVFEDDKPGEHERNYRGVDLSIIGSMLENLTQVIDGPDIAFVPQWAPDRLGIQWLYVSGDPRLSSVTEHVIDMSVPASPVDGLSIDESGAKLASLAWASGGRSGDEPLVERHFDTTLINAGYPLLELVDSSRATVTEPATMRGHAAAAAMNGRLPLSVWAPTLHTGRRGEPRIGDYRVGDYLVFKSKGELFTPDGRHRRRIATMSGSAGNDFIDIGLGASYG